MRSYNRHAEGCAELFAEREFQQSQFKVDVFPVLRTDISKFSFCLNRKYEMMVENR